MSYLLSMMTAWRGRDVFSWLSCPRKRLWLVGLSLIGLNFTLAWISPKFAFVIDLQKKPIILLVSIQLLAGVLYLLAVRVLRDTCDSKLMLAWVFVVGIILRMGMLNSTPILEDDFYRYLWDGAVVANGISPYTYAPGDITGNTDGPHSLRQLAKESSPVAERINHPALRTIYPPVAQAAFSLAYWLDPWNMTAWRVVLLFFDIITAFLLVVLLRTLGLPLVFVTVYWWNPLLIKEILNSGHMDVIILPFVLGAIIFTIRQKHFLAVGALALAIGVKLWPVILLPVILRPLFDDTRQLVRACGLFGVMIMVLFFPVLISTLDLNSGFVAYGQRWEMNDALFMFLVWGAELAVSGNGQLIARILFMVIIFSWTIRQTYRKLDNSADLCRRCFMIISALFLLSPTQFPWYYIWILPFLAIQPRLSLLLLTVTLPLYYLRFFLDARDSVNVFDYGIVWLEYIPVWYLLLKEWYRSRRLTSLA